jgi:hypothetical protein
VGDCRVLVAGLMLGALFCCGVDLGKKKYVNAWLLFFSLVCAVLIPWLTKFPVHFIRSLILVTGISSVVVLGCWRALSTVSFVRWLLWLLEWACLAHLQRIFLCYHHCYHTGVSTRWELNFKFWLVLLWLFFLLDFGSFVPTTRPIPWTIVFLQLVPSHQSLLPY